jgi:toxin-antitoxin system PIN domain toxin
LADGNLLVALTVSDHVHHGAALAWFTGHEPDLATCPITQGTLLRFLIRNGQSAAEAIGVLEEIRAQPWHVFWPDSIEYELRQLSGVIGHRQVTDAYLVALAVHNDGLVATLDRGLAALHPDRVLLLQPDGTAD